MSRASSRMVGTVGIGGTLSSCGLSSELLQNIIVVEIQEGEHGTLNVLLLLSPMDQ